MAETEAEALLRTGALYPMRAGLRTADPPTPLIFIGFKHGAFSVYFGDEPILHFDLEGRWQRAYFEPTHYIKGPDGSVQAIDRPRRGRQMVLDRRDLSDAATDQLDEAIRERAAELLERIEGGGLEWVEPPAPAAPIDRQPFVEQLRRAARWTAAVWEEHRTKYDQAYGAWPFRPPDAQASILLQATSAGGVFGPGRPGPEHARDPESFAEHCRRVEALWGAGALPFRHLFLAGPDVLRQPPKLVESYLTLAAEVFPLAEEPAPKRLSEMPVHQPRREGFQALLDAPAPEADWERDGELGLVRVTLGLSSGSEDAPNVPVWTPEVFAATVRDLKAAGIAVSALILLRAGGRPLQDEHERASASLIEQADLGGGDHVYLVDAQELPAGLLVLGGQPLSDDETRRQEKRLLERLAPLRRDRGLKVLPYTAKKQGL